MRGGWKEAGEGESEIGNGCRGRSRDGLGRGGVSGRTRKEGGVEEKEHTRGRHMCRVEGGRERQEREVTKEWENFKGGWGV